MFAKITLSPEGTEAMKKFLEGKVGEGRCAYCNKELTGGDHFSLCERYQMHAKRERFARKLSWSLARWKRLGHVRINKMLDTMEDMHESFVELKRIQKELAVEYTDLWHTQVQKRRFYTFEEKLRAQFNRLDEAQKKCGGAPFSLERGGQVAG